MRISSSALKCMYANTTPCCHTPIWISLTMNSQTPLPYNRLLHIYCRNNNWVQLHFLLVGDTKLDLNKPSRNHTTIDPAGILQGCLLYIYVKELLKLCNLHGPRMRVLRWYHWATGKPESAPVLPWSCSWGSVQPELPWSVSPVPLWLSASVTTNPELPMSVLLVLPWLPVISSQSIPLWPANVHHCPACLPTLQDFLVSCFAGSPWILAPS